MLIGRVSGLPEPTGLSQSNISDVEFSLMVSATQARQLLGHASNGAERFVPMTFGSLPSLDGLYELVGVTVDTDPNLDAAGLRQVQVSARAQNRGRQVANSVLLVRGDNRNRVAAVGVTSPLYRASVPDGATAVTSYNAGPGGFTVGSAVSTLRGDVRRLTDGSQVLASVRIASTANRALTGLTTAVDGVTPVAGDRVLLKDQSTPSQNGVYVAASGSWARATDADGGTELDRALVFVTSGTANANTIWQQPASGVTIGTTATSWQRAPVFGLRESARGGPVSVKYGLPLTGWYNGACTITQGSDVVTGTTPLASGALVLDNGLIRLDGNQLSMATGSPLAFGVNRELAVGILEPGVSIAVLTFTDATVVTNTPDLVTLRYRLSGVSTGSVDVSMMRGSRTLTVALSLTRAAFATVAVGDIGDVDLISGLAPASEAGTGAGYTSASTSMQYSAADDSDGNRRGLSYAGVLDNTALGGTTYLSSTAKTSHVFGVHNIVGGGTTKTGDDQLFGMDRAWFAMQAAMTSAGVL